MQLREYNEQPEITLVPVNLEKKVETDVGIVLASVEKNIHSLARCLLSIIRYI